MASPGNGVRRRADGYRRAGLRAGKVRPAQASHHLKPASTRLHCSHRVQSGYITPQSPHGATSMVGLIGWPEDPAIGPSGPTALPPSRGVQAPNAPDRPLQPWQIAESHVHAAEHHGMMVGWCELQRFIGFRGNNN